MSKVKASPAVITAVLVISLFVPISTAAASQTASPTRLSGFEQRAEKLHKKIDKLQRVAGKAKTSPRLRHEVLKTNALVKRMNRSLARLGTAVLEAQDVDDAFVAEVVACNATATHLDKHAIRLSRRTLKKVRGREVKALSKLRTQLISLTAQLRKPRTPATPTPTPTASATQHAVPTPTPSATAPTTPTPAPSPTATATPTPTATASPTPTPTATPTPTPTPTNATWTTMTNAKLVSGTVSAPKVYERIIFKGGSSTTGVLHMNYNLHDVVLRDCIIETGPQNGWTINSTDSVSIYNIRTEGLVIRPQPRMGLEFTDRTYTGRTTAGWHHLTLNDVTVEPSGSEAVSFCSTSNGDAATYVNDMLIEGSGNRPDLYSWGQGFEINKVRGIHVDGLTVRETRGSAFNLQGPDSTAQMNWSFKGVVADMRVQDEDQAYDMKSDAQVVYCKNVGGGWTFSGLVVTSPSGSFNGYLDNVKNASFAGTTWLRPGSSPYVSQVNGTSGVVGLP